MTDDDDTDPFARPPEPGSFAKTAIEAIVRIDHVGTAEFIREQLENPTLDDYDWARLIAAMARDRIDLEEKQRWAEQHPISKKPKKPTRNTRKPRDFKPLSRRPT